MSDNMPRTEAWSGGGGGRHSAEGNMGTVEVFEETSIVYTYHGH